MPPMMAQPMTPSPVQTKMTARPMGLPSMFRSQTRNTMHNRHTTMPMPVQAMTSTSGLLGCGQAQGGLMASLAGGAAGAVLAHGVVHPDPVLDGAGGAGAARQGAVGVLVFLLGV